MPRFFWAVSIRTTTVGSNASIFWQPISWQQANRWSGSRENKELLKTDKANIGMKWQFNRNPTRVDVNGLRDKEIPGVTYSGVFSQLSIRSSTPIKFTSLNPTEAPAIRIGFCSNGVFWV